MNNGIVLFENQNVKLEVNVNDETVWLNAKQMARLFDRDYKTIKKHINNVLEEELAGEVVVAKFATTSEHGALKGKKQTHIVEYYNLDVIISVGYRVKSKNGIVFRKWASLTELDVSSFDTRNVTNMYAMFNKCSNLTTLNLNNFETNKLQNTSGMFNENSKLTNINLSKATFNAVTQYDGMFGSSGLTNITVKDADAKTFIDARLKEANINIEATKIS